MERLEETEVHSNNPQLSGTPELLWTGTDARTRDEIIEALEASKIAYHERNEQVGALRNWSEEVYAIFTHARDHRAASAALEQANRCRETAPDETDDGPEDSGSSAPELQAADDDELSEVPLDYVPEDFDPDEATVEVWSGQDATMRESLIIFLRDIGIGSATSDSAGRLRIRVTPASQKRAQEMIRQNIDASATP
ncbi:MAG TPA: hypothetical protein VIH88_12140 [Candidatus Acidoferrales bacterium]